MAEKIAHAESADVKAPGLVAEHLAPAIPMTHPPDKRGRRSSWLFLTVGFVVGLAVGGGLAMSLHAVGKKAAPEAEVESEEEEAAESRNVVAAAFRQRARMYVAETGQAELTRLEKALDAKLPKDAAARVENHLMRQTARLKEVFAARLNYQSTDGSGLIVQPLLALQMMKSAMLAEARTANLSGDRALEPLMRQYGDEEALALSSIDLAALQRGE